MIQGPDNQHSRWQVKFLWVFIYVFIHDHAASDRDIFIGEQSGLPASTQPSTTPLM
jgi:hypothetical protein